MARCTFVALVVLAAGVEASRVRKYDAKLSSASATDALKIQDDGAAARFDSMNATAGDDDDGTCHDNYLKAKDWTDCEADGGKCRIGYIPDNDPLNFENTKCVKDPPMLTYNSPKCNKVGENTVKLATCASRILKSALISQFGLYVSSFSFCVCSAVALDAAACT
eukprot:CAMPEP_0169080008 /NCGR_PEP_ID=MMETSP1015-20121227/10252_1 /TAXON_ID=342587 /ORGANISM="Karlodinium micrum, Strain CCMP2283" /LENGTH=164 /DNA_ID=CAMNT_0009139709 /DNA_START=78 /DNA_END=573 /DNA_ORIENTATION=-